MTTEKSKQSTEQPTSTDVGNGIKKLLGSWKRRLEVAKRHMAPEHGAELERIEREFHEGHGDSVIYELEHLRLGTKMTLAREPRRLPFPSGFAFDYAQAKRAGLRLDPNDREHARALRGRQQFENWYGQLERMFTAILGDIAGLARDGDESDHTLIAKLKLRGDELYDYYRKAKALGDIPWLPDFPPGIGTRDLLDTWERARKGDNGDEPGRDDWGAPQLRLV